LLEEEKSTPSKENGWELFRKTLDYEVWKKRDPGHKADLVKVGQNDISLASSIKGKATIIQIPHLTCRGFILFVEYQKPQVR